MKNLIICTSIPIFILYGSNAFAAQPCSEGDREHFQKVCTDIREEGNLKSCNINNDGNYVIRCEDTVTPFVDNGMRSFRSIERFNLGGSENVDGNLSETRSRQIKRVE